MCCDAPAVVEQWKMQKVNGIAAELARLQKWDGFERRLNSVIRTASIAVVGLEQVSDRYIVGEDKKTG
jgi:hypothetical protein